MAKLKSLNLKLKFTSTYNTHPVVIKYKNTIVQDEINLIITHIDQKEEITFEGFSPDDPKQKISCTLGYNNKEADIQSIALFKMYNNQYVENKVIKNYKDIYFNGELAINFTNDWLRNNILSGANLDDDFCNWAGATFTNEEIFCVGDSFTFGEGVNRDETWPSLINKKSYNFGSQGLSHDGCLKNVKYILKNSNYVKQIICLLPDATRKLLEFEFLRHKGYIPISHQRQWNLPNEYQKAVEDIKSFIFDKEAITNDWIKCCNEIINLCNKSNVECWLSTWGEKLHNHIPLQHRLPIFPDIKTFTERANDGSHPHKKHYELFVKNIIPYIDKTQN
jgi:hypothetical protein